MVRWYVAKPAKLWVSDCGVFNAVRVARADWRLTEIVRMPAFTGVRLVVMEHDRVFHDPKAIMVHVEKLMRDRSRQAGEVAA